VACLQYVLSFVLQLVGLPTFCFQYLLSFVEFFIIRTFCRNAIRTDCHAAFLLRIGLITGRSITRGDRFTDYKYSLNNGFCQVKNAGLRSADSGALCRGRLAVPFFRRATGAAGAGQALRRERDSTARRSRDLGNPSPPRFACRGDEGSRGP